MSDRMTVPTPLPRVLLGSVDAKGLPAIVLRSVDCKGLIVACTDSNRLQVVHNQRLNKKRGLHGSVDSRRVIGREVHEWLGLSG
jgi:hypothetical protein